MLRNESNSSIDSGRGSATGSGLDGAAGVVGAKEGAEVAEGLGGDGTADWSKMGALGVSVEAAISSRREVAASSLGSALVGQWWSG